MHAPTSAPSAAVTTTGRILRTDDAFAHLLGTSTGDLLGRQLESFGDHPDDTASILDCLQETADGSAGHVRAVLRTPDGDSVHVHVVTHRVGDEIGVILIDETRRALDEEELTASNKMLRFFDVVTERSREFITVHGAGGETIYASPAGLKLFGPHYDRPTYAQSEIIHPDDRPRLAAVWARMLTHRESSTVRYRAQSADGEWFWIEQTSTNLLDTEIGGIVSSFRDVSAEVAATQALRASEGQYRAMAETAEEGIVLVSAEGIVTYANARISSIFGLTHEQVIGTPVWSVLEGETKESVAARVGKRNVLERPERYEVPYRHPDGLWRTLWVAASAMPDADGEHRGAAL
ncbi:MAG: PAS domain-containing protein, partial [Aeromicrobium sp.]